MNDKDLLEKIRQYISKGDYRVTYHAKERRGERLISVQDIEYVLLNGYHERGKTTYSVKFQTWNYAIRGNMEDNCEIRLIVALEKNLVVITAIKLKIER